MKLGQHHTDSLLLILSPFIPKIIKNEATKKGACLGNKERKGRSSFSNGTLTQH